MGVLHEIHVECSHDTFYTLLVQLRQDKLQLGQCIYPRNCEYCLSCQVMDDIRFHGALCEQHHSARFPRNMYPTLCLTAVCAAGAGYPAKFAPRRIIPANLHALNTAFAVSHRNQNTAALTGKGPFPVFSVKAGNTGQIISAGLKLPCNGLHPHHRSGTVPKPVDLLI